jgi:hypothetical protein
MNCSMKKTLASTLVSAPGGSTEQGNFKMIFILRASSAVVNNT